MHTPKCQAQDGLHKGCTIISTMGEMNLGSYFPLSPIVFHNCLVTLFHVGALFHPLHNDAEN